jgi:hypothetical protein
MIRELGNEQMSKFADYVGYWEVRRLSPGAEPFKCFLGSWNE